MKYKLKITLLSDMCAGSGEGNGINIDISSSYDTYGLPYIGGRRLKGILRDNAVFFKNNSYPHVTEELINKLYGTATEMGKVSLTNAEIPYAAYIKAKLAAGAAEELKRNMVERAYSTLRYNIEVEENGLTKDKSLRLISAVPEGTVFESEVVLDISDTDAERYELLSLFKNCVKLMRGIGMSRNRGFGEVKCELSEGINVPQETYNNSAYDSYVKDNAIRYIIELEEPVIAHQDYITGSALQGYFITEIAKELTDYKDLEPYFKKLIFSMAYPYKNNEVYYPSPLSLVSKKLESHKKEGYEVYSLVDGYEAEKNVQYVKFGHFYRTDSKNIYKLKVLRGIEYHFNKDSKDIYNIESIKKGQAFSGFISLAGKADDEGKELLRKILAIVEKNGARIKLGASANNQYGNAKFELTVPNRVSEEETTKSDVFVLELLSDTILMDEFGVNSISSALLKKAVQEIFGQGAEIEDSYMATCSASGYNRKWVLPKRKYLAFAAGTQLRVKMPKESEFKPRGFIGLLNSTGYGEYRIRNVMESNTYILKKDAETERGKVAAVSDGDKEYRAFIDKVLYLELLDRLRNEAEKKVYDDILKEKNMGISSSLAMRIRAAHRAVEFEDNYLKALQEYNEKNFNGENGKQLKAFLGLAIDEINSEIEKIKKSNDVNNIDKPAIVLSSIDERQESGIAKSYMIGYLSGLKLGLKERDLRNKGDASKETVNAEALK